jgi:hypothetical protein
MNACKANVIFFDVNETLLDLTEIRSIAQVLQTAMRLYLFGLR